MTTGSGPESSRGGRGNEKDWLWELFARTGFPCALRALRELERQEERVRFSEPPAA